MQFSFDKNLNKIAEKVEANERLTCSEGVELYKTDDVHALGKLADFVQREINIV
jgi:2-iminoacetate synthase ThiH